MELLLVAAAAGALKRGARWRPSGSCPTLAEAAAKALKIHRRRVLLGVAPGAPDVR